MKLPNEKYHKGLDMIFLQWGFEMLSVRMPQINSKKYPRDSAPLGFQRVHIVFKCLFTCQALYDRKHESTSCLILQESRHVFPGVLFLNMGRIYCLKIIGYHM